MNRRGASGIDGETTPQFEGELETRVQEIGARLKAGTYRAPPVRRVDIPKGPGKVGTRRLGIPTVADRLLQWAGARILEAVCEGDFLQWWRQMVAHRMADPVIVRLIGKWLRAGVMQGGVVRRTEEGTPQGGAPTLPTMLQKMS